MPPRAFPFAVAAVVALLGAGCVNMDVLTGASTTGGPAARANDMLAHPPGSGVVPTGRTVEFDLYLVRMANHEIYPGASMGMWAFSLSPDEGTGRVPGPTLRVTEGDKVVVHFHPGVSGYNHTVHWHGQNVPNDQDGVPFTTQKPVEAGESFDYEFIAQPSGTYWYHCHVDSQHHVDMGMYGFLIVDPQDVNADPRYDKEFTLALDDMDRFHLEGGQPATGNLPQSGDPSEIEQYATRQVEDTLNRNPQVADKVTGTPLRQSRNWTPVTYAPYTADYQTFLINGVAFPYTETLVVKQGDVDRLRVLNAGNTMMSLHLHGHHMLVTHKDGVILDSPYWVDTIVLGPGERYDLYVRMDNPGMWELHDHFGGHTQNDNIFPGGAMTMLCYEGTPGCSESGGHRHGGGGGSGAAAMDRWRILWGALP